MTATDRTSPYAHDHIFLGQAHDANARRTLWVVGLTAMMMVGEIIAGYVTGSMALLADGFHMATHAGALSIAAAAYAYARRHARDDSYSFGTGKVGELAGFASALILAVIALAIGVESALRLVKPVTVAFTEATVVATIGLVVNVVSAALLSGGHGHAHGHSHSHAHGHHHGHEHASAGGPDHRPEATGQDNNLRAAYAHVLADALTSVLAITALLAGRLLGWAWLDPLMGIAGAVVIARWSWGLMRETATVLLDRTDTHVADEVRELIEDAGVARITDLHVWRIGPDAHAGIVTVAGRAGLTGEEVRERLAPVHELTHLTVEVRP